MKRFRFALLGLLSLAATAGMSATAQADCRIGNCWGAVAYGPGGAWAWRVNYPTRAAASHAVRVACSGRCTHILTFHNSCGAYAVGSYGQYGWGNAYSAAGARSRALAECQARGPGCVIRVSGCTAR